MRSGHTVAMPAVPGLARAHSHASAGGHPADAPPATAVTVEDVAVAFAGDSKTVVALEQISFDLQRGEFMSILGPSGSGKSTLLRVVADLVAPAAGTVRVNGDMAAKSREAQALGFVFQQAALLPWRTALENVHLPLELGPKVRHAEAPTPEELLEMVGLGNRMDAYPRELSGGMSQRVAIARALVTRTRVLLMDEPFGALDEITREHLNEQLLRIWEETGTTVLFVTHSIPEAIFLSQRVLVLTAQPGRVAGMLDVGLPYPRDRRIREAPEFTHLAGAARELLEGGG